MYREQARASRVPPILPSFRCQFFDQSFQVGVGLQVPVEVMEYRYFWQESWVPVDVYQGGL